MVRYAPWCQPPYVGSRFHDIVAPSFSDFAVLVSAASRRQKENTKTSLWTFKCNLIQKVQKEISKSSLGTFKCSLGTYDCEMTTPQTHP